MNYTDEQLYNMGLIRDRRRRYILVNKDNESGIHIQERDMKFFSFISGKRLFIYLIFAFALGVFKLPMFVSVLLALLSYLGFYAFERFVFFKDKPEFKLSDQDRKVLQSETYLRARRSDKLTEVILIAIVISLIVYSGTIVDTLSPLNRFSMIAILAVCIYQITYHGIEWFKYNKTLKTIKKKSNL